MKKLLALALLTICLSACASPANYHAMTVVPTGEAPNPALKGKMAVRNVYGGQSTNPLWTSQVDNEGFKNALQASLDATGYGAQKGPPSVYIDAELKSLDQPFLGLTMTVNSTVLYHVTGKGRNKEYPISAAGSASPGDTLLGMERLRMANERAIQNNIKAFLSALKK